MIKSQNTTNLCRLHEKWSYGFYEYSSKTHGRKLVAQISQVENTTVRYGELSWVIWDLIAIPMATTSPLDVGETLRITDVGV
jgi:hypothetical protein